MKKMVYTIAFLCSFVMLIFVISNGNFDGNSMGYACDTSIPLYCSMSEFLYIVWKYIVASFAKLLMMLGIEPMLWLQFSGATLFTLLCASAIFSFFQMFSLKNSLKLKNTYDSRITNS